MSKPAWSSERSIPLPPPQVTYRITPKGQSLDFVFTSLWHWGETQL
ncbi:winged helix-turn-helix transcriptional regulator [Rothia sp. HC945]